MALSLSLNVQDLPTSLAAYKKLGFKVDDEWKDEDGTAYYAELSLEGAELGLAHIPSNDDSEFQKWVSTPLGAGVVAYIDVRKVDDIEKKAKASGFLIEQAATDRSYGRVLMLNDPDGYSLSFMSSLKKPKRAATNKSKPVAAKKKAAKPTKKGKAKKR